MDRSGKAIKNLSTGLLNKVIVLVLAFTTKTIFVRLLGAEYNGVSGLYTNILCVLNLADLGISNVLCYYLYSAVARNDENEILCLVNEFRKIYRIIALAIAVVGALLIPFLHILVKSSFPYNEVVLYYLLYLLNSVVSYFAVYRTMVFKADQKEYILNNIFTCSTIAMYILQLVYLCLFHDFVGYLVIQVLCTFGNNAFGNYLARKKYPYLATKNKIETKHVVDKKKLFEDVKATFIIKISATVLDQTDNIIISAMFGTIIVGYYGNYYMIITYLCSIATIVVNSVVAGFGNMLTEADDEKAYKMFEVAMSFFSLFAVFSVTAYVCIIQDFIPIWVGSQYLMDYVIVTGMLLVYFLRLTTTPVWIYISTFGLFKQVKTANFAAAVVNVIVSVVLGLGLRRFGVSYGVFGVVAATFISRFICTFWVEGRAVMKRMNHPFRLYLLTQVRTLITGAVILAVSFAICRSIALTGWLKIIISLAVCSVVTIVIEYLINRKNDSFVYLVNVIKGKLSRFIK